ncbi:phosphate starvation-inducible protein PsiF [Pseudomonas sp. PDNC002]|uniref:PsiF family protein n=1 Tax=Pseudomonas sp. PDNC002 TaxID=2811422 RepID=UPI0019641097|nr:PsiF family protein [Pseudomonas sp. PDNC002]QRY81662.1 phosphate starvation-inducible protein PsiF [Pseudomonas sp. PDNC002]
MTIVRIPLLALALLFSAQGFAATAAQTAQQEKMKTCNADATTKALKGEERKAFMSTCLKAGGGDTKKMTPQQEKMKSCNADATTKALKGDERKAFMSTCLKK